MAITLKQMQYAVALADTSHFGRAADKCFITQPALSQQIRQLEEVCGAPLFDRLGKSVRLTPLGRDFVERSRPILEQAQELAGFVAQQRGQPPRPLRFGMIPTVAPYLLPKIFPALQAGFPELHFTVIESRTDALLENLADNSLDLALIATTPKPGGPKLTIAPLFADNFVLATSAAEQTPEPVTLAAIDRSRMLLLDEGHCFRGQAIAACDLDADAISHSFAATSLSTIVEFVANGQGITLLPEIALHKEASGDRIKIHRLVPPGASRTLSLVWRQATPFARLFEDVAAIVRRAGAPRRT
jgi:LysR family hydrogen peroxide-inducible transcriptional activator